MTTGVDSYWHSLWWSKFCSAHFIYIYIINDAWHRPIGNWVRWCENLPVNMGRKDWDGLCKRHRAVNHKCCPRNHPSILILVYVIDVRVEYGLYSLIALGSYSLVCVCVCAAILTANEKWISHTDPWNHFRFGNSEVIIYTLGGSSIHFSYFVNKGNQKIIL